MKKIIFLFFCSISLQIFGQNTDTLLPDQGVIVHMDSRLDILGKKQAELNALAAKLAARSAMGYRLQVLSTNDRELAMRTKSQLLQRFPEQKAYMSYQLPYIKIKFGNFKTKEEANLYKKQVSRMLGGASIYTITERIEIKPEKEPKEEEL
ncbi:MAG: SPOR domain-containing protein [Chitinophagaceae bacterium]|nr:SPOR domain-containing protein [Chitinophagaceae bacterium]